MKYRVVIAIIIIITFLVIGLIIYANNVLLPVKLKATVIKELEKNLGKNVQIEKLHYSLLKGLTVKNLIIFEQTKEKTYLCVKEMSFHFLILPLLQKKIIIPLVRIDSPEIYLAFRQDSTLNITDILPKRQAKEGKPKFSLFIYKLAISNGKCQFKDEYINPDYTKEMVDLKIGARLDLPGQIKFLLEGKILNPKRNPSFVSASGEYNLLTQELQGKIKFANIIATDYLSYLKNLPLSVSKGTIDNADFDINFKNKHLFLKGKLNCKDLELRRERFISSGNVDIEPDIKYDFQNKELAYKAVFKLSNIVFSGMDYVKDISDIKGDVNLEQNKVWSDNLQAHLLDSNLNIKGAIEDFSNPYVKLNISSSQINLEKFAAAWPNLPKDLAISGNSTLNLEIEGSLKNLPLEIKATSEITSAKIKLPLLKESLEGIKGALKFSSSQLNWENLSFLYKQTQYNSSGSIIDFKQPQIDFSLNSEELDLKTSLNIKNQVIKIKTCAAKYLDSDLTARGSVDIKDQTNPLLNINLESNLFIKDLSGILPDNIAENIKKLKLAGDCKIAGSLKGSAKDIKSWNTYLKLNSPSLSIYDFKLDNLYFTLEQSDGLININNLTAQPYAGNLGIQLSVNLLPEAPLYTWKIELFGLDLRKLKMDTKLKDKDISGLLSMKINLAGTTKGIETLGGQGTVSVKEGKLWELNLFKGLGELLFIPMYQKIVFTNADGNFSIKDKTVYIANAFLGSQSLELASEGKIGFDGSLDLTLNTQINENLLKDSPDIRKFTSAILGNLLVIKVNGTIQKPEYKIAPGTKEIFKQLKRFFLPR